MNDDKCRQNLNYYDQNATGFIEETADVDMTDLYPPFLDLLPPGGSILDAGCGSGRDSRVFLDRGYEVTAMDGSPTMARMAEERLGHPVLCRTFETMDFVDEFDGIWCCASLLHVGKKDMAAVLGRLVCALVTGGVLYGSFKEGKGEREKDGRYFNDYQIDELKEVLKIVEDLEKVRIWRTDDLRPTSENNFWLNFLARKIDLPG